MDGDIQSAESTGYAMVAGLRQSRIFRCHRQTVHLVQKLSYKFYSIWPNCDRDPHRFQESVVVGEISVRFPGVPVSRFGPGAGAHAQNIKS